MSESIKTILSDSIKNYVGQDNRSPNVIRMNIWNGPGWDHSSKTIFQCKGYYKDNHTVYAVPKNVYRMLINGTYAFASNDLEETSSQLGLGSTRFTDEVIIRLQASNGEQVKRNSQQKASETGDNYIGQNQKIIDKESAGYTNLVKLITFFNNEVILCNVAPGAINSLRGGVPNSIAHEVEATLLPNGKVDSSNVVFNYSNRFPRQSINAVPKGGGQPIGSFRANDITISPREVEENSSGNLSLKIKQFGSIIDSAYNSNNCEIHTDDISWDGDLWFEGIRSSISNSIYEVWVDDIGGGPMLRTSRKLVQEAAARYYKDIDPSNQFFNGYRVNPLSTIFASNAITPIKTYIEDLFSDPNFYAGIINVLFAILNGLDDSEDLSTTINKSIDLESLDYGKIYNKYEGVVI